MSKSLAILFAAVVLLASCSGTTAEEDSRYEFICELDRRCEVWIDRNGDGVYFLCNKDVPEEVIKEHEVGCT